MIVGFFPISVSLVIALESFVGEKERHSIEPLLGSPLSDGQLYLGKLLAAMVPPLLMAYLGITVYLVGVYNQVGWTAPSVLLVQILLLTTVQALVMVSGAVVISSQATSVRSANLLASFIIIPMALLIQGEAMIMFWARYSVLWWAILGQVFIAILLIRTGVAHFNREELLGRELDALNLGWVFRQFRQSFKGKATSIGRWYTQELWATLRKLALPIVIMALALLAAIMLGAQQANKFVLPPELLNWNNLTQGLFARAGKHALLFRFRGRHGLAAQPARHRPGNPLRHLFFRRLRCPGFDAAVRNDRLFYGKPGFYRIAHDPHSWQPWCSRTVYWRSRLSCWLGLPSCAWGRRLPLLRKGRRSAKHGSPPWLTGPRSCSAWSYPCSWARPF